MDIAMGDMFHYKIDFGKKNTIKWGVDHLMQLKGHSKKYKNPLTNMHGGML